MKRLVLIIVLALFIQSIGLSQSCLPEGITFSTQAQIDSFQILHPNCAEIEGDVTISGDDITSLNGLNVLTSIGEDLRIRFNDTLTSLTGLDNLTSIGGDLWIDVNHALTSLTGLDNVTSIGEDLRIRNNDALIGLTGLESLTSIGEDLWIINNGSLMSLTGLYNIDEGTIININISNNSSLSTCEAPWLCDYLVSPNGVVSIYNNASGCNNPAEIASACGFIIPCLPFGNYYFFSQADVDNFQSNFPGCTDLEGDVTISGDSITNLNGLSVLTGIGGGLSITDNDTLNNLTGLDNLSSIGGYLHIGGGNSGNTNLTSLTGLEGLTSIGGYLHIGGGNGAGDTNLTSLTGLEGLTSIGGDLHIGGLFSGTKLTTLTGLDNVTSIGGDLIISINYALTSLAGLNNLTTIDGNIFIASNIGLTSLTGLENITSIQGRLTIGGHDWYSHHNNLTSLSGLDNVTSIGGNLTIGQSHLLTSLTGLDNLTSIGGHLGISQVISLTSLTGLDNLTSIGGDLWIVTNPSLSTCEIESICAYLASPNGEIEIHDNAIGCNSPEEVQDSCTANSVSVDEVYILEGCSISPNPLSSTTTLTYTIDEPSTVTITIFNPQGQLIEQIEQEQHKGEQKVEWNAEGLPAGMYYFRIQAGDKVGGGKMVKTE